MQSEFVEFEEYGKVVKQSLENILYDYSMNGKDKVQVLYATPSVAFAKWSQKTVNGQKPGPLVTFFLSGIAVEPSEQMGGWLWYNVNNNYEFRAPVIAKLTYTVTINAIKESQADLLESQIMLSMPFHRPYATKLNGQWVTITASSPENQSSVDIETDKEREAKRQITVEIDRAYLNHPIHETNKIITKINANYYAINEETIDEN